jgi:hypothetical protein
MNDVTSAMRPSRRLAPALARAHPDLVRTAIATRRRPAAFVTRLREVLVGAEANRKPTTP